eukprot:755696-Hanusia_phi.AAC.1
MADLMHKIFNNQRCITDFNGYGGVSGNLVEFVWLRAKVRPQLILPKCRRLFNEECPVIPSHESTPQIFLVVKACCLVRISVAGDNPASDTCM